MSKELASVLADDLAAVGDKWTTIEVSLVPPLAGAADITAIRRDGCLTVSLAVGYADGEPSNGYDPESQSVWDALVAVLGEPDHVGIEEDPSNGPKEYGVWVSA